MTSNSVIFDPTQINLEIDSAIQSQAWRQSQFLSTPSSRWNGYLNQLCLDTLLPWLQEDYEPQASAALRPSSLTSLWEIVNGAPITLGAARLILIPTESIDLDEIRIPQEWVDIPDWIGDYYLIVQVNLDDGWLRIAGFTPHRRLKEQGQYDWRDRTYCLDESDWIADLNVLWVSQQHIPRGSHSDCSPAVACSIFASSEQLNPTVRGSRVIDPAPPLALCSVGRADIPWGVASTTD